MNKRSIKTGRKEALEYHSHPPAGKLKIIPSKSTRTQKDLSLAYSPGVAEPCKEIAKNPQKAYRYTSKGNLVGVITNGSAVLGLGDIGALASKPVMEGKSVLFKVFSDIDAMDLEIDERDPDKFVEIVKSLEPTFGAINLEDIKAPECFSIEQRLRKELNIPVMHDDQHGTAIIAGAAFLNALEVTGKKAGRVRVVFNGAGASAVATANFFLQLGVSKKNLLMADRQGIIQSKRNDLDEIKKPFATNEDVDTLEQALKGADVFVGLSVGDIMTPEMLNSMAQNPVVFAMANPDPEIDYNLAIKTRKDVIMATGRSDFPNQVNNVLGFPFIFRGALDVRASAINEEMKIAAAQSLAELAKKPVPDIVGMAYNNQSLVFGKEYLIPKPIDPRLIGTVAPAVAKAAMDSGVAHKPIESWEKYELRLRSSLGLDQKLLQHISNLAKRDPKRVVFAEADNIKILKAANLVRDEGIAEPILLGKERVITKYIEDLGLDGLKDAEIINPVRKEQKCREYAEVLFEKRKRKGLTLDEAKNIMYSRNYFGSMMVETGDADAMISGLTRKYPAVIRPALQTIGVAEGNKRVAGMYIMFTKKGPLFFADATVNENPDTEALIEITELSAKAIRSFDTDPRIAMLSYTNYGAVRNPETIKISKAVKQLKERNPDLTIDGEVQANFALNGELLNDFFPFNTLEGDKPANTLIFPDLASGNIAYKLLQTAGGADAIGPILLGLNKSVHILQLGSSVREIVNMTSIAVIDAQNKQN